jgi:hypothetical protein
MSRAILVAGLLLTLAALGGCAVWEPPPPVNDTRIVAASPQLALDRARRWLAAHRFEIEKAHRHRSGGQLVASRSPFETSGYARCAWTFRISGGVEPAARVTVIADAERAGHTRVTAKVEIALVNGVGDRAECASHGVLEQEVLTAIASGA